MAGPVEKIGRLRRRHPHLDHAVRTQEHYSEAQGGQQAGAVTYFAFLSVFPVLAIAVFVVGLLATVYPEARTNLKDALTSVLPQMVGTGPGQISLAKMRTFSGLSGLIGLVGVLYTGLGWISALRQALEAVFEVPEYERPGFVPGKLRDLLVLVLIGAALLLSVAVPGLISSFTVQLLDLVGLSGDGLGLAFTALGRVVGFVGNVAMLFIMFRLLGGAQLPRRALVRGAVLGAVGFEVLKTLAFLLIAQTQGNPAFQAFGIALVLVVWINYFSRLILYAAAWAWTDPDARAQRTPSSDGRVQGPALPSGRRHSVVVGARSDDESPTAPSQAPRARGSWLAGFAAGGFSAVLAAEIARHRKERS